MNTAHHSPPSAVLKHALPKRLRMVGIVFILFGILAILLPGWATLAGELIVAWMLTLWGVVGLWFAWEMRAAKEWQYAAIAFGITLLLGVVFLLWPRFGIETLTVVMMLVFLAEGVVSILLGLRMSSQVKDWGWMMFSGACSLILGGMILFGWPDTAVWVLGILLGVNFLSTGISLLMLDKAAKDGA